MSRPEAERTPRAPTPILVVDTNILLGQILGYRSRPLFRAVGAVRTVAMTARTASEMRGVLRGRPEGSGEALERLESLLAQLSVIPERTYDGRLAAARDVLRDAVASRNGSVGDAHLLACG